MREELEKEEKMMHVVKEILLHKKQQNKYGKVLKRPQNDVFSERKASHLKSLISEGKSPILRSPSPESHF